MYLSDKDNHDNGTAIVEYENGARATHSECFITSVNDRRYSIVGTLGQLEASLAEMKIEFHPRWGGEVVTYQLPVESGSHGGADLHLLETFVRTLRGELKDNSNVRQGMLATAIGQAAELSRRNDRTVMIKELMK